MPQRAPLPLEGRATRRSRAGWGSTSLCRGVTTSLASQVGELHVGTVLRALDVLGDRLAADHAAFRGVVRQRRRTVERPALVDRRRHAMAEGGVVGTGQVAVGGEAL